MASYSTNEFRGGLKIMLDGDPCSILENEFVKPGKGQAFNRVKLRNLKTGRVWERTFKSGESLEGADVIDVTLEYLYNDGGDLIFMDNTSYDQIPIGGDVLGATEQVTELQREQAAALLTSLGKEIFVEDEKYVSMSTAVSGTGPAYVFMVMESLIDAAVHLGFPRHIAHDLVIETLLGGTLLAQESGDHPAYLRNMVTSPAGTSAAAIAEMEKGRLRTVLSEAVFAAYRRTEELGRELEEETAAE